MFGYNSNVEKRHVHHFEDQLCKNYRRLKLKMRSRGYP